MRQGHFKAAEHYILYRAERARLRERRGGKRRGSQPGVDGHRHRRRRHLLLLGRHRSPQAHRLRLHRPRPRPSPKPRSSANSAAPSATRSPPRTSKTPSSSTPRRSSRRTPTSRSSPAASCSPTSTRKCSTGRILRDGIDKLKHAHKQAFKSYLKHGVAIKRLNPELLDLYDLDKLAEAFDPTADLDFDYLGIQTLYDRYLIVDKTGDKHRRIETPQFFWMRVAMGLFKSEETNREDWAIRLYNLYKGRRFCSSTPTLFNSGTLHSQLSSCYLYKVDDSIESIMYRGIAENAFLSQMGRRPRRLVDRRPRHRRLHPGHQWRVPGHHPLPQAPQRPARRRQPGRQTPRLRLRLPRDLAQRHRGLPRPAQEHR